MTTTIDKIAWIHLENGQILGARSKGKDTYYLPGGKREAGEEDVQTLIREIDEELTVRIIPDSVTYFGTFEALAHGKSEGVNVKMTCYLADYTGSLSPASEIEQLLWLNYSDRDQVSAVCQLIFDSLHEMNLLD
ncbi:NUDIX domain-containing protein [Neobacillus mesonae]|nr:NUDIX domain-containing protein [Neobacillus mesonae]